MKRSVRTVRSVLYVPGNNQRAMEKSRTLPVDAIIFDLEDGVSLRDLETARKNVCEAVAGWDFGRRLVCVRINDLDMKTGEDDLRAILSAGPDVIVLPKVETAGEIVSLSSKIDRFDDQVLVYDLQIWAMIETPMAILNSKEIAKLSSSRISRLSGFVIGTNDLVRMTGAARAQIKPWLMDCVLAAKAYDLSIVDGVCNDYSDMEGLRKECQQGRNMGMDGKTLIHPNQIECCNEIFSPTRQEIDQADEIVDLFETPENSEASVLSLHGRMVERLHYETALETLRIANMELEATK